MSKLDDILGTSEIARLHPDKYGNVRKQTMKLLIKELFWEGINRYTHLKKLTLREKAELVKAMEVEEL